ncbi:MAG: NACHT domain-containing protein, partial [Chloroflexi bacterium]|nr:NACHT domain-containing protein [Chloroflexota bacterium]
MSICEFPEAEPFVDYLLHSGRTLVLWDGLDEVKKDAGERQQLIDDMHNFMRQYRETQFLVTCRVAATHYEFDNVQYVEMADFDDSQKRTFIHHWFADNAEATRCWQELQKEANKGLQELARVPLLLTLLAITYDRTLTFPQRRVEIYEEAIDALLKSWDSKRRIKRGEEPYKELSLGRKRQMLSHIAAEAFAEGEFLFPKRKLAGIIAAFMKKVPGLNEADIDGELILRSIAARHGIFVEQAKDIYSFAHLSFQEYFTAKYIANNARQGTLERLLPQAEDDQWREVFLL